MIQYVWSYQWNKVRFISERDYRYIAETGKRDACCSPIISTFLSTYVVSHSNGVKKGILSFVSFFFGKMVSVSLLCMVSALTAGQFISEGGYIGSFNLRLFSQTAMSAIGAVGICGLSGMAVAAAGNSKRYLPARFCWLPEKMHIPVIIRKMPMPQLWNRKNW